MTARSHRPAHAARLLLPVILVAYAGCGGGETRDPIERARGRIARIERENTALVIALDSANGRVTVPTAARIRDSDGTDIGGDDLYPGFTIEAVGHRTDRDGLVADDVVVRESPPIVVTEPADGAVVDSFPLAIRGYARVFENVLAWRVRAEAYPSFAAEGRTEAASPDVGRYGPFEALFAPEHARLDSGRLTVEVFSRSPRDGAIENVVTRTIELEIPRAIILAFGNRKADPNADDCAAVYPVRREPAGEIGPGDALRLLLAGPTAEETARGFLTAIPSGTALRSARIVGRTARVDLAFPPLGGACLVTAIRAQIERTMRENFPVDRVVIAEDGSEATALQP